jgi:hypothetical protein
MADLDAGSVPRMRIAKVRLLAFMQTKPYGSWNRANGDTVTCREAHAILTSLRPEVHCPHVGKTGGMVCVDVAYESYFDTRYRRGRPPLHWQKQGC